MKADTQLDDLTLNAYVDGQLEPEIERVVLIAMRDDPEVREQVCRLRRAKDWMILKIGRYPAAGKVSGGLVQV